MKRIRKPGRREPARQGTSNEPNEPLSAGNVRERQMAGIGARDPRSQGRATRAPEETATRRHLEGAEQGPM